MRPNPTPPPAAPPLQVAAPPGWQPSPQLLRALARLLADVARRRREQKAG